LSASGPWEADHLARTEATCKRRVDAELGDVAPHIGVVSQRLGIAFRLPGVDHLPQLVVGARGGAHGIFKGSRLEQLFRDGALAPLHPPPADFCLYNMGIFELGLDPADVLPPLKPA
jgi:hypothetical protein